VPVPMVVFRVPPAIPGPCVGYAVGVVEAHQALAVGGMQGEGIGQAVRTLRRWRSAFDLELQPIAVSEVADAPIERQQIFECVPVGNWLSRRLSCQDRAPLAKSIRCFAGRGGLRGGDHAGLELGSKRWNARLAALPGGGHLGAGACH
jgi:hypothetical protein